MKLLLTFLLAVAPVAWAGVPDVLVGFHNAGPVDFAGDAVSFTMAIHTSYAPLGYNGVITVNCTVPPIPGHHSVIVDIPLPQNGPNYPTADWVQFTFLNSQPTGQIRLAQTGGYNTQARVTQVLTFEVGARTIASVSRRLYPVTSHGKVVRFILK